MDFFILGNPRSGTTLLRLMLNTHSLIGVPPECGMILWWYDKYKTWSIKSNDEPMLVLEFIKDILSSKKVEDWGLTEKDLLKCFKEKPKNYIEVFKLIYQNYTNKKIVGDKNNYYINELNKLSKVYNNTKYIHLVRDGRDVACSYLKIKDLEQDLKYIPKLPSKTKVIAEEWNQNIIKIDNFLKDKNAYTVKYEDLLKNPTDVLTKICAFLGVAFESEMLNFSNHNNEPIATLKWKQKTLEKLDVSNFSKFRSILSKKDIEEFNQIAKDSLTKYNYEA